jgi:hypothetical protein
MRAPEPIETVILRMTDRDIQQGLRNVDSEDIVVFFRLCSDDRVKAKILANMSSRAGRYIRQEIERAGPGNPETDRERHAAVTATLRAAAGERQSPPEIDSYDTATVRDLIDLLAKLADKARWDLPSLAKDADKVRHRLLRDGLRVIARETDAIRVEEQLVALAERHVEEEQLVAKLVKAGLGMIFDSQVDPSVRQRLTSMVPFMDAETSEPEA